MPDDTDLRHVAAAWYYAEHFGFAAPPPQTDPEVVRNMALCLLTVLKADREISGDELRWIVGYFAAKGYPAAVIDEVRAMQKTDAAAVADMMQLGILRASGRILLYDAIRAAHADGYHPQEMRAVRAVASGLGLDDATVDELERLVIEEDALKKKRIRALMPQGHPSLHGKYAR
jgi:hypothetical protein